MKRASLLLVTVPFLVGVALAPRAADASAWSQPLWSVISGGGGRATGTNYAIEVVIGQPIAGPTTGTNSGVMAGFLQAFENFSK